MLASWRFKCSFQCPAAAAAWLRNRASIRSRATARDRSGHGPGSRSAARLGRSPVRHSSAREEAMVALTPFIVISDHSPSGISVIEPILGQSTQRHDVCPALTGALSARLAPRHYLRNRCASNWRRRLSRIVCRAGAIPVACCPLDRPDRGRAPSVSP